MLSPGVVNGKISSMTTSIPRRLHVIKKLFKEYFPMEYGVLIERHSELKRVFDVRGSKHGDMHPHKNLRVYITRRSIKHFVESRKRQFEKRHTEAETMETLYFAIDHIQEVITNFDSYQYNPPATYVYSKDYSPYDKSILRVIVEVRRNKLEIKSIHFREKS